MATINLSPDDSSIQRYYEQLQEYDDVDAMHEGTVRSAFQRVLQDVGRQRGWTLVEEHTMRERGIRVDGAVKNEFDLYHGYWEAKDSDDDLEREVQKKLQKGYPTKNTVFQAPNQAVLVQDGGIVFEGDIDDPRRLVDLLKAFFEYSEPAHEEWERAVDRFKERVPELGQALKETIEREREENRRFRDAFQQFFDTCKQAINPNLAEESVEEMLIQHLLTERIFRTVFDNPDFVRRNVIAKEIENVIDALASRSFSRRDFLNQLDPFYNAIEEAAGAAEDFSEKQKFLNSIYEQFFQGFAVDVADTHGIVYTPQPIVDFMVESVSELLEGEFDVELGDEDVHVLDPFVGTGNFIMRVMKEISGRNLPTKYGAEGDPELHANEVMLLPYYVASMNVEHEYYNRIGEYEPFEGICLVDTFGAEDQRQRPQLFTEENTERVKRQQAESIKVIIGNPPYNAWQVNANDNNQNRTYEHVDDRVRETYAKDSSATLKNALYDPYVKAIRWATDRIGEEGVVAFVTNNSFVDNLAFDGMRKHLAEDFDAVYVLDCGGNVRKNPKLSGTTHNVFGIQVGVSINFFVKRKDSDEETCDIRYYRMEEFLRKEERYEVLDDAESVQGVDWETLEPDEKNRWLVEVTTQEFESYLPVGSKNRENDKTIFADYTVGVKTSKDAYAYAFDADALSERMEEMIELYNTEVDRWANRSDRDANLREFLNADDDRIKWTRELRRNAKNGRKVEFDEAKIVDAAFRPYTRKKIYFDQTLLNRRGLFPKIFPPRVEERENRALCVSDVGYRTVFSPLMTKNPGDLHLCARHCLIKRLYKRFAQALGPSGPFCHASTPL